MKQSHRIIAALALFLFYFMAYSYKGYYPEAKLPNDPMWIQMVFTLGTTIITLRIIKIIRKYIN